MKMTMTRTAAVLMALCLLLSLCACGAKNKDTAEEPVVTAEPTPEPTPTPAPTPEPTATPQVSEEIVTPLGTAEITAGAQEDGAVQAQVDLGGGSGEVEVEDGDMTVSVTVPAALADSEILRSSLTAVLGDAYSDAVQNDDGSVTYSMTLEQYDEILEAVAEAIDGQLGVLSGNSLLGIAGITHNDDFTEFDVTLTGSSMGLMTSVASVTLYTAGRVYNLFAGNADADITVNYLASDGNALQTGHSSQSES